MSVELIPVRLEPIPVNFGLKNLAEIISEFIEREDIVAVSSKVISYCEGRIVNLSDVKPSEEALELSRICKLDPSLCELIVNEADEVLGCVEGFVLTLKFGMLCPNAGIDTSNAPEGFAVLYPKDPKRSADLLRGYLERSLDDVGVVITDSRILPLRRGVCGIALAYSGFRALVDERGKPDLFGKPLKNTFRNLADMIACASQLLMGEANEGIPIVILRGLEVEFGEFEDDLTLEMERCLYRPLWRITHGEVRGSNKPQP